MNSGGQETAGTHPTGCFSRCTLSTHGFSQPPSACPGHPGLQKEPAAPERTKTLGALGASCPGSKRGRPGLQRAGQHAGLQPFPTGISGSFSQAPSIQGPPERGRVTVEASSQPAEGLAELCVFSWVLTPLRFWAACGRTWTQPVLSVCGRFQLLGLCSPARCGGAPCHAAARHNTRTPFPTALVGKLRHDHMHSPSQRWQRAKDWDSQGKPFFETLFWTKKKKKSFLTFPMNRKLIRSWSFLFRWILSGGSGPVSLASARPRTRDSCARPCHDATQSPRRLNYNTPAPENHGGFGKTVPTTARKAWLTLLTP